MVCRIAGQAVADFTDDVALEAFGSSGRARPQAGTREIGDEPEGVLGAKPEDNIERRGRIRQGSTAKVNQAMALAPQQVIPTQILDEGQRFLPAIFVKPMGPRVKGEIVLLECCREAPCKSSFSTTTTSAPRVFDNSAATVRPVTPAPRMTTR